MLVDKNKIRQSLYVFKVIGTLIVLTTTVSKGNNNTSLRDSIFFEKVDSSESMKENTIGKNNEILLTLTGPALADTITDAHCYGSADGSLSFIISGSQPPFSYSWNTGVSGKVIGSCWNIITINNPGVALTNYQIKVTLSYQQGMKKNFSDVRFSNVANTTLYNFWLESKTDSASAVFWVKVPSIPAGSSSMSVSYCNSTLSSGSNGLNTFEFFDDFDDGNISDWTKDCQNVNEIDETCTVALDNTTYKSPGYGVKLDGYAHCGGPTTDGVKMALQKSITLPAGKYSADASSKMLACLHSNCADSMQTNTDISFGGSFPGYYLQISRNGTCSCIGTAWYEENWPTFTSTGASAILRMEGIITDCGSGTVWKDNVRIRKEADQPPTVTVGTRHYLQLTNLTAGDYSISVTDAGSASASQTYTVNQPALPSAVSASRCDTGTVPLSVTGAYSSYKWFSSSSGGAALKNGSSFTPDLKNTTTYYVAGVGDNKCQSSPRVAVTGTINSLPASPVATGSSICGPGKAKLKASGSSNVYAWYSNSSGGSALGSDSLFTTSTINSNTTYYVSSIDLLGCESKRSSVLATVDPLPQGVLSSADTIKQGANTDTMKVSGKIGTIEGWQSSSLVSFTTYTAHNVSDTFYSESALAKTTYFRAVIKSGSCPDYFTNAVKVTVNIPHICFPDTAFAFKNDTLISSETVLSNDIDSTGDLLNVNAGTFVTGEGGIIQYNSDGSFTYIPPLNFVGKDSSQYTACDLYEPDVSYCRNSTLYIFVQDTFFLHGKIVIYHGFSPNGDMVNDTWIIDGIEKYPQNKVVVFDRWGNLVFEEEGYENTEEKVWKGKSNRGPVIGDKSLPDGTYFYRVQLGEGYAPKTGYVIIKR